MQELPYELAIVALKKCLLLPGCTMSVQLFEPRHWKMYEDLPQGKKYIGIVQPHEKEPTGLHIFRVGTVAQITSAQKLASGRYTVMLRGVRRFSVEKEVIDKKVPYRKVRALYEVFLNDPSHKDVALDRDAFFVLLNQYIQHKKMKIKMENIQSIRNFQVINVLSQVLPFSTLEKQSLLEVFSNHDRMNQLIALLKMETSLIGQPSTLHSEGMLH